MFKTRQNKPAELPEQNILQYWVHEQVDVPAGALPATVAGAGATFPLEGFSIGTNCLSKNKFL
jgi:hypothetical protein